MLSEHIVTKALERLDIERHGIVCGRRVQPIRPVSYGQVSLKLIIFLTENSLGDQYEGLQILS